MPDRAAKRITDVDGMRDVASRLGIDLDEAELANYAESAAATAEAFDRLEAAPPVDDPAEDVEEGTDAHNAMQYRFELPDQFDGPLSDLEVVVKENMAVAGVPMHCGSQALEVVPDYHASVVRRLHEAGAHVVGTTNMDEFAHYTTGETCAFGPTQNPIVEDRVPGGSSSGSAAAVAAGLADASLGSDTGGSIRIPASYCGLVGLKPTYGRVSRFGFVFASPTLDHIGPIARDVETAARVFDVIAGPDWRDPTTRGQGQASTSDAIGETVKGTRIGLIEESFEVASDGVCSGVEASIDRLESEGVDCTRVSVPSYSEGPPATLTISGREFPVLAEYGGTPMGLGPIHSSAIRTALSEALSSPELGDHVREQLIVGARLKEKHLEQYVAAKRIAGRLTKEVSRLLESYDALVTPTMPTTPPGFGEIDSLDAFLESVAHTAPFNLTGHPALTMSVDGVKGDPVGIQFIGKLADERAVLRLGSVFEASDE